MTGLATAATSTSAWDQPGTLGFLVVFGMGIILYFVFRSMSRHLKKLNAAAADEAKAASQGADEKPRAHPDGFPVGPAASNGSRPGGPGSL